MAKVENLQPGASDNETAFPALEAAHFAASVMLQMLIEERGDGPWVEEVHENMRNSVDRGPPPEGWPGTRERWRAAQHRALRAIFDHRHMVGSVKPKN